MVKSTGKRILLMGDARQVHTARWRDYLVQIGYHVLVVSLEPAIDIDGATQRVAIPGWVPGFVRYPMAVPVIRRIISRFDPHLINAHFAPNYGVAAALTGFKPWVLSTWGSDIMILPQQSAFHLRRTRWVIQRASFVTSDADVMTRRLVELGADPDRVLTFPFGVDRAVFYPATQQTPAQSPRILSNRKLEPVYSIDTIVPAFSRLLTRLPDATLTIAGDGSELRSLRAAVARTAAAGSVRFAGTVAHAEVAVELRRHDIFVSMALSDTTSVSLLEAMACGIFPIVSDIPANREWIEDGHNGLTVAVRDVDALSEAIARAWNDASLRARAATLNAEIIAQRADWDQNMSTVKTLFARLLAP